MILNNYHTINIYKVVCYYRIYYVQTLNSNKYENFSLNIINYLIGIMFFRSVFCNIDNLDPIRCIPDDYSLRTLFRKLQ